MHAAPRATFGPWQALCRGVFGTFAGTKRLGKLWRSWLTAERGLWRRGTHREAAQGCDGTSGIRGLSLLAATPSRRDRPGLSVAPATLTSGVPETPTEILRPALEWRARRKVGKSFCFFFFRKRRSCLPSFHPRRGEAWVLHFVWDDVVVKGRPPVRAARISASCRCWFSAGGRRRRIWEP
jgi:hypothetical protein